jgi:hypothetical protein
MITKIRKFNYPTVGVPGQKPADSAYDGTHISPPIRAELGKLGPEKAKRVRDVADRYPQAKP